MYQSELTENANITKNKLKTRINNKRAWHLHHEKLWINEKIKNHKFHKWCIKYCKFHKLNNK